jgi:SnoaL-like domain
MIEDLWQRYSRIWSIAGDQSAVEMQACLSADVSYCDPNVSLTGLRPLADYMAGFRGSSPGREFRIRTVKAHHDRSVARWDLVDADGSVVAPGISFGIVSSDGKFQFITGFFGDVGGLLR